MELADFKKLLHAQMQDTLLDQYKDYLEAVILSTDPEVKRKCVAMHISTIGAEHKEKVDPGANLPVFNFTFTSAGMTASSIPTAIEVQPDNLTTFDMTMLNPAARVALNRDVMDFGDDEC